MGEMASQQGREEGRKEGMERGKRQKRLKYLADSFKTATMGGCQNRKGEILRKYIIK